MLTTHLFRPTWKMDAPAELYIVAYNNLWYTPKDLLAFRIHLISLPENQDFDRGGVKPVLKEAVRTRAVRLPWDSHCITNSGHAVCLRKKLRCYSLFAGVEQPMAELKIDGLETSGGGEPTVTVEPWSGTFVAGMKGTVRVFQLK